MARRRRDRAIKSGAGWGPASSWDVEPGSAAEAAGLRTNDVILEVNHRAVRDAADATGALRQAQDARVVFLLISRGGMQMFVSMRQP